MKKPNNYYCHRSYNPTTEFPKHYEVIDKIGEGAFGQVFKVFNTITSSIQVMKRNKGDCSTALIKKQTQIMNQMQNSDGFARVKDESSEPGCIVMTLLGDNLENIIEKNSINIVDVKRIAYQCLLRLKELHDRGYVHRDIKPENILLGNQNNPHKIYLVDFGLAGTYKKTAMTARKAYAGEIGTIKFCPLASHYGLQQFPKDDLQSLGYLLVYLSTKDLPWYNLPKGLQDKQKFDLIKKKKQQAEAQKLCKGIGCLRKYLKIVNSLKVGNVIDYDVLLKLFTIECEEIYCYSFCKSNCFAKIKQCKENNENSEENIENKVKITIGKTKFQDVFMPKKIQKGSKLDHLQVKDR